MVVSYWVGEFISRFSLAVETQTNSLGFWAVLRGMGPSIGQTNSRALCPRDHGVSDTNKNKYLVIVYSLSLLLLVFFQTQISVYSTMSGSLKYSHFSLIISVLIGFFSKDYGHLESILLFS